MIDNIIRVFLLSRVVYIVQNLQLVFYNLINGKKLYDEKPLLDHLGINKYFSIMYVNMYSKFYRNSRTSETI